MLAAVDFIPRLYRVVETAPLRRLRQLQKNPDLFIYQHMQSRNYMLSDWVVRGSRMYDLICLGKSPHITSAHIHKIQLMRTGNPEGRRRLAELRNHWRTDKERHLAERVEDQEVMREAQREIRAACSKKGKEHVWFASVNNEDNRRVQV